MVSEIPYLVNKARLVEKIADLVRKKGWLKAFRTSVMNRTVRGCGSLSN